MSLFRQALILLALAAIGAYLWHLLASDPGYLLLTYRGWSIETSLTVAVFAVLLAWLLFSGLLWLLRAPFAAWRRQRRRIARERLADGLLALEDGRWARADKLLGKAAADPALRLPALLAAHRAAHARGDAQRASALLADAGMAGGEAAARLLTVEHLLERGQFTSAAELLESTASRDALSPRGIELRLRALVGAGRAGEALDLLPALRRSRVREGDALEQIEASTIAAALTQAPGVEILSALWGGLTRAQRLRPELVDAYAARMGALGDTDAASEAIVKALKKTWSEVLARRFGGLGHADRPSAIRLAERWLGEHADSPGLCLSLGRLCRAEQLWGKAEDYLQRALGGNCDADAWEALAELYAERDDDARARQAYGNALRAARGETALDVRRIARQAPIDVVAEERSSMGVPRLPGP